MDYTNAKEILLKELLNLGGVVFARNFFMKNGREEDKNAIEADMFLSGILSGKFVDKYELEKDSDYLKMIEISKAIKKLK